MDYSINQNPQNVQPQQPEPKKHIPTWLGLAIIIAVVIIAFGGVFAYQYFSQPDASQPEEIIQDDEQDLITGDENQTAGWKTYKNDKYGFEVKYAPKYSVLSEQNNFISGPDDKIGRTEVQIGVRKEAPTVLEEWFQITVRKNISTLDQLKNFYIIPAITSDVSPIAETMLADQKAYKMKFYQQVAGGFYVDAVGVIKNGTAFIVSKWEDDGNEISEEEFNLVLSTFKFTK